MRKIVVDLGRIRTDLRLSAFIAKPPGHGGSAFKNSIIRMLRGIVTVCLPTSRHEEQLVGKTIHVIVKGIEKVRKNFGYCKEASVIFDEALPLIVRHDDRYDKFWGYMNTALDTYGENLIEKRAKRYELAPGYLEACDLCRYYDEKLQEFCLSLFQLIRSRKFTYVS